MKMFSSTTCTSYNGQVMNNLKLISPSKGNDFFFYLSCKLRYSSKMTNHYFFNLSCKLRYSKIQINELMTYININFVELNIFIWMAILKHLFYRKYKILNFLLNLFHIYLIFCFWFQVLPIPLQDFYKIQKS
jgi:hypothetical protein